MKYYSEKLNTLFDTVDALTAAEKAHDDKIAAEKKKEADRAARAEEVYDAYIDYKTLLRKFTEDYGTFRFSYISKDKLNEDQEELAYDRLFKQLWF